MSSEYITTQRISTSVANDIIFGCNNVNPCSGDVTVNLIPRIVITSRSAFYHIFLPDLLDVNVYYSGNRVEYLNDRSASVTFSNEPNELCVQGAISCLVILINFPDNSRAKIKLSILNLDFLLVSYIEFFRPKSPLFTNGNVNDNNSNTIGQNSYSGNRLEVSPIPLIIITNRENSVFDILVEEFRFLFLAPNAIQYITSSGILSVSFASSNQNGRFEICGVFTTANLYHLKILILENRSNLRKDDVIILDIFSNSTTIFALRSQILRKKNSKISN